MKICLKALSAALSSLILVNFLCMFYYSAPGDIYRDNGATKSIRRPSSYYINSTEGFGINYFDKNGYNNMAGELESPYVLIMGSSHMEATYVSQEKNTPAVLNSLLGGTNQKHRVYNIAHANNPLPDLVRGFQAGIGEFPNSCAVIMEISSTSFSVTELQDSLQQTIYDQTSDGAYLSQHLTGKQQLRSSLIGWMPFAKFVLNRQLTSMDLGIGNPFGLLKINNKAEEQFDRDAYATVLDDVFSMIRNEYSGTIVVLYHPEVVLVGEEMIIVRNENTYDIFRYACEDNDIFFLDTGDAFLKAYEDNYTVPYGFNNTSPGSGHLNADGHRIVACELYQALSELQEDWK